MLLQNVNASSDRQYIRSGNRFYRQENYAKAEVEYRKALNKKIHWQFYNCKVLVK